MATHSSILAWRIPVAEESGELHTVHGVAESDMIERLSKLTHTHTHTHTHTRTLFFISFQFRSPQSIGQSYLCYTVGFHQLSIVYIVEYICQSQSPNSSLHHPFPDRVHFKSLLCGDRDSGYIIKSGELWWWEIWPIFLIGRFPACYPSREVIDPHSSSNASV